jgi:hypothetical protein
MGGLGSQGQHNSNLPEREFSEENQEVAMKHESQLLFPIHLLFVVFPPFFHDYRDSSVTGASLVSCDISCVNASLTTETGRIIYSQEDFFGKITMLSYRFGN